MFFMAYNCRLAACNLAGMSVGEQTAIIVAGGGTHQLLYLTLAALVQNKAAPMVLHSSGFEVQCEAACFQH